MRTPDMFGKPRRRPRNLMHPIDIGWDNGTIAEFECSRCGYETDWLSVKDSEVRKGIPCPNCNQEEK